MCGIAGFWNSSSSSALSLDAGRALGLTMGTTMAHRGPDAADSFYDPQTGIGLAHRRLAIVDLSEAGQQPMHSESGRFVLVYNGEIYNFPQLRKELEDLGAAPGAGWRGHSDTEIALAAMETWGIEQAVHRFVGMFAMGVWDRKEQTLTLIRDRMGIKPLYYGFCGPTLVFGSELAALKAHPDWAGSPASSIDRGALALYFRYLYIPAPYSIHPGIHKLEPGAMLTITPRHMQAATCPAPHRYWKLEDVARAGQADPFPADLEVIDHEIHTRLSQAVQQRMIADVPLGAFLSGGIDSSTVVALMQDHSQQPVRTFTIGSTDAQYDESVTARAISRQLGTSHTELLLTPDQGLEVVPMLGGMYDEPFADASQIPTFLVSRMARTHVTVSLSGDGGDELFTGYNRHLLAPRLWNRMEQLPAPVRRMVDTALRHGGESLAVAALSLLSRFQSRSTRQLILRDKVRKVTEAFGSATREEFYHKLVTTWHMPPVWEKGCTLVPDHRTTPNPVSRALAGTDYVSWMMGMDQTTYLPGDILTKVDRASMAVSLEARVPMLDHRVVEAAWRIPPALRTSSGRGKMVLRRLLSRYLDPALLDRPKSGFGLPLDCWLRGPLKEWGWELLRPERLKTHNYLNPAPIHHLWEQHQSGQRNNQYHLWGVLMFQAWLAHQESGDIHG